MSYTGDLIQLPSIRRSQPLLVDLSSRQISKRLTCTCRISTYSVEFQNRTRSEYSWRGWRARLNASTLSHRKDCELFRAFEKENSLNLKLVYCRGIIGQVIKASIHLRRGAGGFSISPSLSCIRMVSDDSPAFKLVHTWIRELFFGYISRSSDREVLIRKLQELFQHGRASPHDVTISGRSLLHVSPFSYSFNYLLD